MLGLPFEHVVSAVCVNFIEGVCENSCMCANIKLRGFLVVNIINMLLKLILNPNNGEEYH